MKIKKKLIISIIILGIVLIGSVGAVVGVLAAQNQSVSNNFTVTYQANNVSAKISAWRNTKETQRVDFTTGQKDAQNQDITELEFTPTTSSMTGSLSTSNIILSASDNYAIITYKYENTTAAGGRYLAVTLADNSLVTTNMNVWYYPSSASIETYETITAHGYTSYAAIPQKTLYIAPQESFYFYQIVEIADSSIDASFSSNNAVSYGLTMVSEPTSAWTTYVASMSGVWSVESQIAVGTTVTGYVFDITKTIEEMTTLLSGFDYSDCETGEPASSFGDVHVTYFGTAYILFIGAEDPTIIYSTETIVDFGIETAGWQNLTNGEFSPSETYVVSSEDIQTGGAFAKDIAIWTQFVSIN